jgi:hypothetical protein
MKKIAFLVFITAILFGVALTVALGGFNSLIKISIGRTVGSGNVVTEKRDVAAFTGVDFGGAIEVEIAAQKEQSVEVEGDDNILPLIETEVRDGILYISNKERFSIRNRIKVRIGVDELNSLNVSGASKTTAANVKADKFDLNISGASKAEISGEAIELTANASGASKINAEGFKVKRADVDASGASTIMVNASEDLDANASGASKIRYAGSPQVSQKATGASSVKQQ